MTPFMQIPHFPRADTVTGHTYTGNQTHETVLEMNNNTSNPDVLLGLNKAGRMFSRDSHSSFILITELFFLHPEQKHVGLAEHTSTKNIPAFMPLFCHSEVLGFIHTRWENAGRCCMCEVL